MGRPLGSKNKKHIQLVKYVCPTCNKGFERYPSWQRKYRKRGCLTYCSRKCADVNRKNVWKKFGSETTQWSGGSASYRQRALKSRGYVCEKCGYDGSKYPNLIWVHHMNFKPRKLQDNHNLDNLAVLCIRCHLEEHLKKS